MAARAPRPGREGPPRALRAVLFDLDGVLVDSVQAWFRVANRAAERFGAPPIPEDRFRRTFGQSSVADAAAYYPGRTPEEVDTCFQEAFRDRVHEVARAPGARAVLERARREGLRLACVTNTPHPLAEEILAETGLRPLLDAVAGVAPRLRPKPEPDLVLAAARALGVPPEECVLVGDTAYDVEAGRRAGVFTIGLGVEGDATIRSLAELETWLRAPGIPPPS